MALTNRTTRETTSNPTCVGGSSSIEAAAATANSIGMIATAQANQRRNSAASKNQDPVGANKLQQYQHQHHQRKPLECESSLKGANIVTTSLISSSCSSSAVATGTPGTIRLDDSDNRAQYHNNCYGGSSSHQPPVRLIEITTNPFDGQDNVDNNRNAKQSLNEPTAGKCNHLADTNQQYSDNSNQQLTNQQNLVKLSKCATATCATTNTTTATTTTTTTRSSVSSLSSCILTDTSSQSEVRIRWGKKMDFLLSIIGFAVDLANIWRFPYLVYKNGGGVFLIPYLIVLIFGGIPLFFLELCLGQYVKKGPITVWNKICPYMKGVGYCSILISWYVSFYYNVLIAWGVYFIYRSLISIGQKLPWEDCDNAWNSKDTCVSISQLRLQCSTRENVTLGDCRRDIFKGMNVTSPTTEFFVKELSQLDQSTGLEDMGYIIPELVVCLIIVYLLHYFSLFRGLETSGKVVWVTATAPYMILSILLVRGLFLPGASLGIDYYLSPKFERLSDPTVWTDAAGQVFYSIGVGFGVHLTYASFNPHNNDCYRDCIMTSAVNVLTSIYSGLVVFVYLGYMATNLGVDIDKVASEGYSLAFEVYPEALTTLPFARFWSISFFIMVLTLGIDSAVSIVHIVYHVTMPSVSLNMLLRFPLPESSTDGRFGSSDNWSGGRVQVCSQTVERSNHCSGHCVIVFAGPN